MRTNFISRLIGRITASNQPNNDTFTFYGHRIDLQSGTTDYVDVTIYRTASQYCLRRERAAVRQSSCKHDSALTLHRCSGYIATFSFDYLTKELYIEYAENKAVSNAVKTAFRNIYGHIKLTE